MSPAERFIASQDNKAAQRQRRIAIKRAGTINVPPEFYERVRRASESRRRNGKSIKWTFTKALADALNAAEKGETACITRK